MKLMQKEILCKEELKNSQSTSKLKVSVETISCNFKVFQNKVISKTLHATNES